MRVIRIQRPDWIEQGACRGGDPKVIAMFFTSGGHGANRAKAMCADCPVINECRSYALDRPEMTGVWGGTTETDRDRLRRRTA